MDHQTAAIILCAGLGSRLGLAEKQNKCAVPIRDTSAVQYGVSALLDTGADEVIAVTGYASESVRTALSEFIKSGRVQLVHNSCYDKHGCNYSLACAMEAAAAKKAGRVIIAEGDSLLYRGSVRQLFCADGPAASLVREKSYADPKRSVIAVGCKNKIVRYEYDALHHGDIRIDGSEEILGESMQLWSFSGSILEKLKDELYTYKTAADKSPKPMLHSGVYSINRINPQLEPVFSKWPDQWINLNTQEDLRKAGSAEWIRK
ncbi:MAG: DUF6564 domain-containing protein [Clostridium sp.]